MISGFHHQCTSTQDGQDLLRVLATKATTHETVITGASPTSRARRLQDRKIGQSKMTNMTIRFPRRQQKLQGSHTSNQYGDRNAWRSGGNQDQIGPRSETSADDEVKHDVKKGPEEVVA
jgi:uncharacterized protein YijF (DUF1287 family)